MGDRCGRCSPGWRRRRAAGCLWGTGSTTALTPQKGDAATAPLPDKLWCPGGVLHCADEGGANVVGPAGTRPSSTFGNASGCAWINRAGYSCARAVASRWCCVAAAIAATATADEPAGDCRVRRRPARLEAATSARTAAAWPMRNARGAGASAARGPHRRCRIGVARPRPRMPHCSHGPTTPPPRSSSSSSRTALATTRRRPPRKPPNRSTHSDPAAYLSRPPPRRARPPLAKPQHRTPRKPSSRSTDADAAAYLWSPGCARASCGTPLAMRGGASVMTIGPDLVAQILRLHEVEKWRVGTIARQLHVHRDVVRRVLGGNSAPVHGSPLRASRIDVLRPFILETLTKFPALTAARL